MKFNNIPDFLNALEDRMNEISSDESIMNSTQVDPFTEDEYQLFDTITDEARALCDKEGEVIDFIYNRLSDKGYDDDQITKILDYEGFWYGNWSFWKSKINAWAWCLRSRFQ